MLQQVTFFLRGLLFVSRVLGCGLWVAGLWVSFVFSGLGLTVKDFVTCYSGTKCCTVYGAYTVSKGFGFRIFGFG